MSSGPRSPLPALHMGELQTFGVSSDLAGGARTLRIERVVVSDLRLQTVLGSVRAASVELSGLTIGMSPGSPGQIADLAAAEIAIAELRVRDATVEPAPVSPRAADDAPDDSVRDHWRLEPLASLDGTVHARIVDAAWIFDADVTIPIEHGRVDFNRVTVEHVGPDSSMGIGPMGIYVEGPGGRTYLFQLSARSAPAARFEQRGIGLTAWADDRGAIDLRPLLEGALSGVEIGTLATGTPARMARTRLRGELRLGDGVIGNESLQVVLAGRERGSNRIELESAPSGGGVVLHAAELSATALHWKPPT
jgi:hypothetical protein